MPQRKIIVLMDSTPQLNGLLKFALNNVFLPRDLGVALFHQELYDHNLSEMFSDKNLLNIRYTYVEIFDKIFDEESVTEGSKNELLSLLETHKVQPQLFFEKADFHKDIYEESLFADLMVCSTSTAEKVLNCKGSNMESIGECIQCPVLVIPDSIKEVQNIFLVFDGKPESMKAIKDFNYMLSHLYEGCNVTILSTTYGQKEEQYKDKLLMQYATLHIPNVAYMKINGNELKNIIDFTRKSSNSILVMGTNKPTINATTTEGIESLKQNWKQQPVFITKH